MLIKKARMKFHWARTLLTKRTALGRPNFISLEVKNKSHLKSRRYTKPTDQKLKRRLSILPKSVNNRVKGTTKNVSKRALLRNVGIIKIIHSNCSVQYK